ncbi:MAG: hypothetical protein ACI8TE_000924 [Francisella sp.]|jgi:hypothetical protein
MKKTILIIAAFAFTTLASCTTSQGDSFGYTTPPPTQQDMDSNEAGALQQPGGVVAGIESEDGNPNDNSDFTIRE